MDNPLFETKRLMCRQWVPADIDPIYAVYSDPESMRWVGDGQPISMAQCKTWLEVTKANYAKHGYGMFALVERASGTVIGFCGFIHPGGQPEPEIKYAFAKSFWGKGLASEAVPALLDHGAAKLGLRYVIATIMPANLASQRVLLKSGMLLQQHLSNSDGSVIDIYEWRATGV